MRKVIYSINQSLDGNCDHTKFAPDDELMAHYTRQMRDVDTLAYGRKLYELMVPYWPAMAKERGEATQADYEFAQAFAAIPHLVVFSRTLRAVEPANARLVKTDAAAEIARMKGQDGGDIHISGIDLASQLIEAGLVDLVIVYKIDRLSRSLLDFARVMERLTKHGTGLVSVTQNFSTADAMGRLTLNMLMSFAEFERSMIAERTRDKIVAARRKGLDGRPCAARLRRRREAAGDQRARGRGGPRAV